MHFGNGKCMNLTLKIKKKLWSVLSINPSMINLCYLQPEYKLADPICTFLFSILVLITTLTILRDALHVLMEGKDITDKKGYEKFVCDDGGTALDNSPIEIHVKMSDFKTTLSIYVTIHHETGVKSPLGHFQFMLYLGKYMS